MNNFVMMVGLPASGKSTYIDNNLKGYTVFSSDEYRGRMFKTLDTTKEQNAKIFEAMHKDIIESLRNKENVIYDACNISSKRRKNYLESIKKYLKDYKKICTIIATPFKTCVKNNNERNKYKTDAFFVPNKAITKMWKNFYIPYY